MNSSGIINWHRRIGSSIPERVQDAVFRNLVNVVREFTWDVLTWSIIYTDLKTLWHKHLGNHQKMRPDTKKLNFLNIDCSRCHEATKKRHTKSEPLETSRLDTSWEPSSSLISNTSIEPEENLTATSNLQLKTSRFNNSSDPSSTLISNASSEPEESLTTTLIAAKRNLKRIFRVRVFWIIC